jgi:hypothetical protein
LLVVVRAECALVRDVYLVVPAMALLLLAVAAAKRIGFVMAVFALAACLSHPAR